MTQLLICGEALELARSVEVDMAVLDLNLAGEMSYPVAEVLQARGVPMIFAIGYGSDGLSEMFRGVPAMRSLTTWSSWPMRSWLPWT